MNDNNFAFFFSFQVETLRSKLDEANGDILALRRQLQKGTLLDENDPNKKVIQISHQNDYEQLVQNLERIQNKVNIFCI